MTKQREKTYFSTGGIEMGIIPIQGDPMAGGLDKDSLPDVLPVLALRAVAVFPGAIFPITIGREKSRRLVSKAETEGMLIAAIPQSDPNVEDPGLKDLNPFGSVARVLKTLEMPDGSLTAVVQALGIVEIKDILSVDPYLEASVSFHEETSPDGSDDSTKMLAQTLRERAAKVIRLSSGAPREAADMLDQIDNFHFLVNFIATTVEVENFNEKAELLGVTDMSLRAMRLLTVLGTQIQLLDIKQEINRKVQREIDQQQREYYLNNQLRTIQEELGMDEGEDIDKFRAKADKKKWSAEMKKVFSRELQKLQRFNPSTPEYAIEYNYIQFLLDLPWDECSKDNLDLGHAKQVLDDDHYGLDKVKERIIEYLAVLKLKGNMKSPILCLYGPPGVGKTSLGKSIARALGRKYVRISLGGMHDEAEIRGHRKTYVGALPGRILSGIQKAGTSNPVLVLDEIDKLASDFKGDPASALLEVLDPEQNNSFHDNYLDLDYDLSNVMFITTANAIAPIQPALRDRMEMIDISGYLAEEKYEIARRYLIPKQTEEHGLKKGQLSIGKPALAAIVDQYTHESGVRGLEKQIAKIARVTARKIATGEEIPKTLKPEHLKEYLGLPVSFHDRQKGNEGPGVVTGLAWTEMGGEILFVETSVSKGKGSLTMTGNLGDVMKESAQIAYQYIKAHPELAGLTAEEYAAKDIHVHVPEGAVPKDGPSAGITMVSSMVSALRGEALRHGIAMTGEMTLRGRVLPVGGIKEKILAAKRAGVHTIVISEENRKDVEDIPAMYVEGLAFHYVKTIDEVLSFVF